MGEDMRSDEFQTTNEPANEIDWLAFRYVANEMSNNEREQFEERLFDDQAAREAVASAVELTQTIAGIETVEHSVRVATRESNGKRPWQRATWIAAAIAGCLAIVLGWQLVGQVLKGDRSPESRLAGRDSLDESDSDKLAKAWLDAADESMVIFSTHAFADGSSNSTVSNETEGSLMPGDSASALEAEDLEAPDWMMAAVSGMNADMPETSE